MTGRAIIGPEYASFVRELKERIVSARVSAARAVNGAMILLYWDIGRAIVERQKSLGWGESVVEILAKDLQREFPGVSGFSSDNLWRMRQFYAATSAPKFLEHLVPEIGGRKKSGESMGRDLKALLAMVPWGHHVLILKKTGTPAAMFHYLRASAQLGWSRNVLLNQIKAKAFERSRREKKSHNFSLALPERLGEQAEETIKSSYSLEFLGLNKLVRERELEDRLVEKLKEFILELGYGFCFIGRQYRLTVNGKDFFVDLLFYHRVLKALVAVELKVGAFEPEFAGKMDFYLNLLNQKERSAGDNPSIGIILCAEKDDVVVEFSLKSKANPIGVAEYHLTEKLPKELRGRLPTERELRSALMPGKGAE